MSIPNPDRTKDTFTKEAAFFRLESYGVVDGLWILDFTFDQERMDSGGRRQ